MGDSCTIYWTLSGLPPKIIAEMELELTGHLEEAVGEGKTFEKVVGKDIYSFARSWADPHYVPKPFKQKVNDTVYILLLGLTMAFPFSHIDNMSLHFPVDWSIAVKFFFYIALVKILMMPFIFNKLITPPHGLQKYLELV